MRNTFLAHSSRVTATLPALGTIVSVPLSDTTLWMPICTPEWTVPISTSTWSRLTRRSAFCGRVLGLGLVVELDELDLAAAELAALLRDQHLDGEVDVLAELGERARVGEHQADLQGLGLRDGPADRDGRGRGERRATFDHAAAR